MGVSLALEQAYQGGLPWGGDVTIMDDGPS